MNQTENSLPLRPLPPLWQRLGLAALSLIAAAAALIVGMSIPSHFRSVSPLVLEAAADGTPTLATLAEESLQRGQPGMAAPLLQLLPEGSADRQALQRQMEELYRRHATYRWSGGPAPFYQQFLAQAAHLREDQPHVLPSLLPGPNRSHLLGFLEASSNQMVLRLLDSRHLVGWQIFSPVFSSAGQPLDAAILTTALLEQSAALQPALRADLQAALNAALATPSQQGALHSLEAFYAAIVTIGRHVDWLQLELLMRSIPDRDSLLFFSAAIQQEAGRITPLLASMRMQIPADGLRHYLSRHQDNGWQAVNIALPMGQGALQTLIHLDRPLYVPPRFWYQLPEVVRRGQFAFKGFSESAATFALAVRVFCFAICGYFLVGLLRNLLLGRIRRGARGRMLWQLDRAVGAVLVMLLLWILIEPGLLEFPPNEAGVLQIQLAQILPTAEAATSQSDANQMIDQVTIIVLLLFLVLQLFVFVFGLLKLAEIRRQQATAELKLALLDNEEVLFDLGLYVGLGGTVGSLIMIVLNMVDASLMAAYASTLFGILFVGILKVGFLRPFRRSLLLQMKA